MKGVREHLSEVVDLRPNLDKNDELLYDHPGHPHFTDEKPEPREGTQHGLDPQ